MNDKKGKDGFDFNFTLPKSDLNIGYEKLYEFPPLKMWGNPLPDPSQIVFSPAPKTTEFKTEFVDDIANPMFYASSGTESFSLEDGRRCVRAWHTVKVRDDLEITVNLIMKQGFLEGEHSVSVYAYDVHIGEDGQVYDPIVFAWAAKDFTHGGGQFFWQAAKGSPAVKRRPGYFIERKSDCMVKPTIAQRLNQVYWYLSVQAHRQIRV